jgi:hypothetical protein
VGTVFGDLVVTTAILDRLLHHSLVLTIREAAIGLAKGPPQASAKAPSGDSDNSCMISAMGTVPAVAQGTVPDVSGQKRETLPPDAAAGHNEPVTGLSDDGTFHLLSVRGPLTNQFPRT